MTETPLSPVAEAATQIPALPGLIAQAIERHASTEKMTALIDKNVGEVVQSAVRDALSAYGRESVGQQLAEAVKSSIQLPADFTLPSVTHMILTLVQQTIEERFQALLDMGIKEQLEEFLTLGAREIKLSDVVKALRKRLEHELDDRYGSSFTVIVEAKESDYGTGTYYNIGLDEHDREEESQNRYYGSGLKPLYRCDLQFAVSGNGSVSSFTWRGKDAKQTLSFGYMDDEVKMVFALFATKGKMIIDETEFSTRLGDD